MNSSFADTTVLVTGAGGFIGTRLCRELSSQGAIVHGTSRSPATSAAPHVQWTVTGLNDAAAVRSLLLSLKPDVIFHLAGPTSASRSLDMVLPVLHGSLVSTVNLLTAAAETGYGRVVLAGSMETIRGDASLVSSAYAAAKQASQVYAHLFSNLYSTAVSVARIFMVYGPEQADVRKLVPYVILSFLRRQAPKLSSGERAVDWVYVDDVVDGLMRMALTPGLASDAVDLGTGRAFSVRDVVTLLQEITGSDLEPEFGAIPDRPHEVVAVANLAETAARIDWAPSTTLKEGLRRTFEYFRVLRSDHVGPPL